MLTIVAYAVRSAKSKAGNDYWYQVIEVQQSPERPNASMRRIYNSEDRALAPGTYKAKVSFYLKGYELLPSFYDFQLVS